MPPANREEAGAPPIRELSVPKDVGGSKTKKKKLPKKDTGSRGSSSSPQSSADYDEFDHDEQALLDLCFDEESRAAFASKPKKPANKLQRRSSNSRESLNDTASNASGRKGVKSSNGSITSDKRSKSSKQDNSVETERNNTEDFLAMFCGQAIAEADEDRESLPQSRSPQPSSKPFEEKPFDEDIPVQRTSGHSRLNRIDAPSIGSRRSKGGRSIKSARDESSPAGPQRKVAMTSQRNVNSRNVSSFAKPVPRDHDDGLDKDERGGKGGSGLGQGDELVVPLKRIPSWTSELTGLTSAFPGEYDEEEDEDDEDDEEEEEEEDEDEISYLDAFEEALPVVPVKQTRQAPEESALRSGMNKRESGERAVSFNVVSCRNYERIIDDNPSVTAGPGIGIGWRFNDGECVDVDDWEEERGERRRGTDLVLNREEREELLLELGYTDKDLATAVRRIVKAKNQRKQTVNNLGAQSVEETLENATKKVRGFLKLVRRSKA